MLLAGYQFGLGHKTIKILQMYLETVLYTPSFYLKGIYASRPQLFLVNPQAQQVPLCTKSIQVFAQP